MRFSGIREFDILKAIFREKIDGNDYKEEYNDSDVKNKHNPKIIQFNFRKTKPSDKKKSN